MKKLFILIALVLCILADVSAERKKVGLVLSGGGAKGVAHIGVIKVLEEAGIPIDYIAGTSMGAIIGGLYSIGYDSKYLDSLVRNQNWTFVLSDMVYRHNQPFSQKERNELYLLSVPIFGKSVIDIPVGFVGGQNVNNLFTELTYGYQDSMSFKDLPIPYACVATNLLDGSEMVLESGILHSAMRASMAIPGVFAPVMIDSVMLVDGGISNNFPVDVVRRMGAEIVIGVDVSSELQDVSELNSALSVLEQLISFLGMETYNKNRKATDIYMQPDIEPYSAASFDHEAIDTLIRRGEEVARSQWNEIIKLKELIGISESEKINTQKPYKYVYVDTIYINSVSVEGVASSEAQWLRRKYDIDEKCRMSVKDLRKKVDMLYATGSFSYVNYSVTNSKEAGKKDVILTVKPKRGNLLNIGFRFDNEDKAALLLNTTITPRRLPNMQFELTGRLSVNPYVRTDFYIGNSLKRKLGISYMYKYNDIDLYEKGKKTDNLTYSYHFGELSFADLYISNFKFLLSCRYEAYNLDDYLTSNDKMRNMRKYSDYFSYNVRTLYDTYDKKYYPNMGIGFKAGYSLYTDDLLDFEKTFSAINMNFASALSLTNRFCVLPEINGRILIGDDIPFVYQNFAGGMVASRYLRQQLAFRGVRYLEKFDNVLIEGGLQLRYRMGSRHYFHVAGNYMVNDNNFFSIFDGSTVIGASLGYSYDLLIGPMDIVFSISDRDNKLGFYFDLGYFF
ncbi:MAG: patatin-like phospholipase family protein [Culturomica sp.]|nr:patatin-like phospholipase family protein [Culturomica sp.]